MVALIEMTYFMKREPIGSKRSECWLAWAATLELLGLTNARAVLDDGVELSGLVLDAVVVVVEVVHVVDVVVVNVSSFQSLGATEVLLTAESVLVDAWLVTLAVDWHLGWDAAERLDDLGGASWHEALGLSSGANLSGDELLLLQLLEGHAESGVSELAGCEVLLGLLKFRLFDGLADSLLFHLLLDHSTEELLFELLFSEIFELFSELILADLFDLLLHDFLLEVLNERLLLEDGSGSDEGNFLLHWLRSVCPLLRSDELWDGGLGQLLLNILLFVELLEGRADVVCWLGNLVCLV